MENLNKKDMIEAGGTLWEKGSMSRVYFNSTTSIAKLFNCAVVEKIEGLIPKGFEGMLKKCKTKSYYDIKNDIFVADDGAIANVARSFNLKVKRG